MLAAPFLFRGGGKQAMAKAAERGAAVDLKIAAGPDEIDAVQGFRYRVQIDLQRGESVDADAATRRLGDSLDASATLLCLRNPAGSIVATARLLFGAHGVPPSMMEVYRLDRFMSFGPEVLALQDRLVIAPEDGAAGLAAALIGAAFRIARRQGGRFLFASCPPAQVRLYEQLGYRRYADNYIDRDDQYLVPLVLLTEDYPHLARMNSPFAKLIAALENPGTTAAWFARSFPDLPAADLGKGENEERLWRHLTERLNQNPLQGVPMLAGLDYRDARRFIGLGTLLRVRAGDRIVSAGTVGREMFVLIAGEAEVWAVREEEDLARLVTSLAKGAVFGEIGFLADSPRTADVVALTDGEVLVLTQQVMTRAIAEMPAVAAQVLLNLSLILCERLRATTARLL